MSSLDGGTFVKIIDADHNHIDSFVLETEEGTKRTKDKFHREASESRNSYVNQQLGYFQELLKAVKSEIKRRYSLLMPVDKTGEYDAKLAEVSKLLSFIVLNSDISDSFKLKLDYIISSRYHSIVHAYKEGTPSIIIGWADKYKELAHLFSQENYMFDINDEYFDFGSISKAIDSMVENYQIESKIIKSKLKEIQDTDYFSFISKSSEG